jgi:hypothetical protein
MINEQEAEVESFQEPNTKQEPNTGIIHEPDEEALDDAAESLQEPNTR